MELRCKMKDDDHNYGGDARIHSCQSDVTRESWWGSIMIYSHQIREISPHIILMIMTVMKDEDEPFYSSSSSWSVITVFMNCGAECSTSSNVLLPFFITIIIIIIRMNGMVSPKYQLRAPINRIEWMAFDHIQLIDHQRVSSWQHEMMIQTTLYCS